MKIGSKTAGVYAEALAELAGEAKLREATEEELLGVAQAVQADPAVWKFFQSPVLPVSESLQVIEKVFKGRVSDLLFRFLVVLAKRKRLGQIPGIAVAFTAIMDRELGRRRVSLTSAVALSEDERKRITEAMEVFLKAQVVLTVSEEPDLIGGLLIRSDDIMIDTSLRSGLRRIRTTLLNRKTIGEEFYED